jgi:hypothetical protein
LKFQGAPENFIIDIDGNGSINDVELILDGKVRDSSNISQREFDLSFSFPGFATHLTGSIDTSNEIAAVDLEVDSKSESLGDLLETMRLARALDGKGQLSGQIIGSMSALKFEKIATSATSANGTQLEAKHNTI